MIIKKRKNKPDVEIIVLTWNKIEINKNFLKKLYKNTLIDFGLILIDNNSNDGTDVFLREFSKNKNNITLVLNDKNEGCINGRNQGWLISSSFEHKPKYILFIDNDQIVGEGWLQQHLNVLKEGYDIVGVEAWQVSSRLLPIHHNTKPNEPFSYVGCGGMLICREVIEDIGLFDSNYNPSYFEDPDFVFRAYNAGYKIGWNFKSKIKHIGTTNISNDLEKQKRFMKSLKYFRKKWENKKIPSIKQKYLKLFD